MNRFRLKCMLTCCKPAQPVAAIRFPLMMSEKVAGSERNVSFCLRGSGCDLDFDRVLSYSGNEHKSRPPVLIAGGRFYLEQQNDRRRNPHAR
jgi:hypothetical protein